MIRSVSSDHESFKSINFEPGFNVILADRTQESTDKDSRNGLGKTLTLEIIDFCLGSKLSSCTSLNNENLLGWSFILEFDLGDQVVKVSRNTKEHTNVEIKAKSFSNWEIQPVFDEASGGYYFSINDWNKLLSNVIFNIPLDSLKKKYSPSFRSLISYFIRSSAGSLLSPFKNHPQQKEWDVQVNNAFLIDLNYEYASDFQKLKDESKLIGDIKKGLGSGLLESLIGTLGDLEAEKVRLSQEIETSKAELKQFKIHPQYYDIQNEADGLTKKIHSLTNSYIVNKNLSENYHESFLDERDVSLNKLEDVYKEAGLVFPDGVVKRIEDVIEFHFNIVKNRKEYLELEMARLKKLMEEEQEQVTELSEQREKLMSILQTHGALEEYSAVQNRISQKVQTLQGVTNKIKDIKKIQDSASDIRIRKEELARQARQDKDERQEEINKMISLFDKNSEYLYSQPGTFSVAVTDVGYKFDIEIKRSASQGIGLMKIFTYGISLIQYRLNKVSPRLLIHDSTIFDGVDERQVAKALELAIQESEKGCMQYICTLNTDDVPYKEFSEELKSKFNEAVRITFSDATEDGGLLGARF